VKARFILTVFLLFLYMDYIKPAKAIKSSIYSNLICVRVGK